MKRSDDMIDAEAAFAGEIYRERAALNLEAQEMLERRYDDLESGRAGDRRRRSVSAADGEDRGAAR